MFLDVWSSEKNTTSMLPEMVVVRIEDQGDEQRGREGVILQSIH